MKKFFIDLWDRLTGIAVLESDSPRKKREKTTLVLIAFLCCIAGILSAFHSIINSQYVIEIIIPLTFTVVVGIALVAYILTKRFNIILYPFLIMIFIIPMAFQISIGGFSGQGSVPIILWSLLAPFGSLMFQDIKKATWWFIAYLVLFIVLLSIDGRFARFAHFPIQFSESAISHVELMISNALTLIILSIIIFISMRYFVGAFQREHARAEKLVIDLTETNNELKSTLSELKRTQAELVQSEKMAGLGQLAAGIAHEINNPIGALQSTAGTSTQCVSALERYLEKSDRCAEIVQDEKLQSLLKILKDSNQVFTVVSDRVSKTVKNFIDFVRLDKAGFARVDIHKGIDNTLALIEQEIKAETRISKKYGEIPEIACYPGELNQVFMNLLKNAAQAIEREGEITIKTYVENDTVHVEISDTGIGIPAEKIKGLFDPSFTRDETRVKASMGLFTSYNIVKKHDGEIKVESVVGKGSTFAVILPFDREG